MARAIAPAKRLALILGVLSIVMMAMAAGRAEAFSSISTSPATCYGNRVHVEAPTGVLSSRGETYIYWRAVPWHATATSKSWTRGKESAWHYASLYAASGTVDTRYVPYTEFIIGLPGFVHVTIEVWSHRTGVIYWTTPKMQYMDGWNGWITAPFCHFT